jgi:catechol 2,3-dioxygenase-like lactoylglutathione lyase family enzyme
LKSRQVVAGEILFHRDVDPDILEQTGRTSSRPEPRPARVRENAHGRRRLRRDTNEIEEGFVIAFRVLVNDVEAARAFYVDLLGFQVVREWGPAFAEVSRDGVSLWLSGPQSSAARPMPDGRKPQPGGWNRIAVIVRDLEGLVRILKDAGVVFRNEIITGPGGSQIVADDPSGNPVELFEQRD